MPEFREALENCRRDALERIAGSVEGNDESSWFAFRVLSIWPTLPAAPDLFLAQCRHQSGASFAGSQP